MSRRFRIWDAKDNCFISPGKLLLSGDGIIYEPMQLNGVDRIMPAETGRYIVEFDTGLEDKSGRPIFEGDIVRYDAVDYEYYLDETLQGFNIRRVDGNQRIYGSASYESVKYGRVVGTVHEGMVEND